MPPAAAEPAERASWPMLALAWLLYAAFGLTSSSLAPLVTPIRDDLHLSFSEVGLVLGAWQLVYIGAAPISGPLIDRVGTRRSLLLGVLVVAASCFARSLATSFVSLFAAVALFGLGGSILSIGLPKLVAQWFSGRPRALATGIYATGSTSGSILALSLTNALVVPLAGNWRTGLQWYALAVLLAAGVWLLFGREPPEERQPSARRESSLAAMRQVAGTPGVWPVVIVGFAAFVGSHGYRNWLPQILEWKGLSPADAGFVAALPALSGIFGSIVLSRLVTDPRQRQRVVMALLVLVGIQISVVALFQPPLILGAVTIEGFCSAGILPLMMQALMEMPAIGPRRMGAAAGLYFSIGEIGGFTGPLVMGSVTDATGGSFLAAMLAFAALMLVMLIPALRLPGTRASLAR